MPKSRAEEDFAALVDAGRYRGSEPPPMVQPTRYEDLLRQLPVRVEGSILEPTIVGEIPLWKDALVRIKGRPMGENPSGFAELLGRF